MTREPPLAARALWAEYLRIHVVILRLGNAIDVPALRRLYQACERAGLATALADDVLRSIEGYERERVLASIEALRTSDLRFTLLADYCQLAHTARIGDVTTEPPLVRLSAALGITRDQHDAIGRYIQVAEEQADNPWRDEITEIRIALRRIARSGADPAAVSGTQSPLTLRSGSAAAAFAGLMQFCAEVLDDDARPSRDTAMTFGAESWARKYTAN